MGVIKRMTNLHDTGNCKMLTGLLKSQFGDVSSFHIEQRRADIERNINPHPYFADYTEHKLHMDQNQKLTELEITVYSTIPIKNNILIYDDVYGHTRVQCVFCTMSDLMLMYPYQQDSTMQQRGCGLKVMSVLTILRRMADDKELNIGC